MITIKEKPKDIEKPVEIDKEKENQVVHTGKWGVYLIKNKGKINRVRTFNSMVEANNYCREYMSQFDKNGMDDTDITDKEGKPYEAFSCVNERAGSVMIYTEECGERELNEGTKSFPLSLDFSKDEDIHYQKAKKMPKGSTIGEKKAMKEYGLSEEELHQAYKDRDIVPMRACMMGSYYNKLIKSEIEKYLKKLRSVPVKEMKKDHDKSVAEIKRIDGDINHLKSDISNKKRSINEMKQKIVEEEKEIEKLLKKESELMDGDPKAKSPVKRGRGRPKKQK